MQQVLYTRDAVRQTTAGGFHRVLRKNVSYNKYEDHIQRIEKEFDDPNLRKIVIERFMELAKVKFK